MISILLKQNYPNKLNVFRWIPSLERLAGIIGNQERNGIALVTPHTHLEPLAGWIDYTINIGGRSIQASWEWVQHLIQHYELPSLPPFVRQLTAIAAIGIFGITGCSRDETPAVPRTAPAKKATVPAAPIPAPPIHAEPATEAPAVDKTRAAELMQAIFGDDYRAEDGTALVSGKNPVPSLEG